MLCFYFFNLFFFIDVLKLVIIFGSDLCRLPESLNKEDKQLYLQTSELAECLSGPGYNAERLSVPYVPQVTGTAPYTTTTPMQHAT